jgi:hypothetical protein
MQNKRWQTTRWKLNQKSVLFTNVSRMGFTDIETSQAVNFVLGTMAMQRQDLALCYFIVRVAHARGYLIPQPVLFPTSQAMFISVRIMSYFSMKSINVITVR